MDAVNNGLFFLIVLLFPGSLAMIVVHIEYSGYWWFKVKIH